MNSISEEISKKYLEINNLNFNILSLNCNHARKFRYIDLQKNHIHEEESKNFLRVIENNPVIIEKFSDCPQLEGRVISFTNTTLNFHHKKHTHIIRTKIDIFKRHMDLPNNLLIYAKIEFFNKDNNFIIEDSISKRGLFNHMRSFTFRNEQFIFEKKDDAISIEYDKNNHYKALKVMRDRQEKHKNQELYEISIKLSKDLTSISLDLGIYNELCLHYSKERFSDLKNFFYIDAFKNHINTFIYSNEVSKKNQLYILNENVTNEKLIQETKAHFKKSFLNYFSIKSIDFVSMLYGTLKVAIRNKQPISFEKSPFEFNFIELITEKNVDIVDLFEKINTNQDLFRKNDKKSFIITKKDFSEFLDIYEMKHDENIRYLENFYRKESELTQKNKPA